MFIYYLFVIAGFVAVTWILAKGTKLVWFEWLLAILGWLLGASALQNWTASVAEAEPRAGMILGLMIGIPALILLGLGVFLPYRRIKKA